MIVRHKQAAIRSLIAMAISGAVAGICVWIACTSGDPPVAIGLMLAIITVLSGATALVCFCRAHINYVKAKGLNASLFLVVLAGLALPAILKGAVGIALVLGLAGPAVLEILLPDQGSQSKDDEDQRYPGSRCVCCNARIPSTVKLCPQCGWTQPAGDTMPAVAAQTTTASAARPA